VGQSHQGGRHTRGVALANPIELPTGKEKQVNKELYDQGQKLRREILGDTYVDKAAKTTTDFNRPFQELIAEYVWGTLWSRPGLDRRTRALINLGMLTAMGRTEEVKIYLGAAPNIGVTRDDVREVLMQTAIYCGIPAALDSFRVAQQVFDEQDAQKA
jgi:4-carboxymuconolactone decarboxylase